MSARVTLSARAKLTRTLRVTGVRPDGYHVLDTEMMSIDLADSLEITPSSSSEIEVVDETVGYRDARDVPLDETNLVLRALDLLSLHARVRLVKRIPPGAGLGGGSSDAAAVLRWAGRTDPLLAARLGSDVPFCVRGGRARVGGIGEKVQPLQYEDRRFVLLVPPLAVSTAAVYRAWDVNRGTSRGDPARQAEPARAAEAARPGGGSQSTSGNDLEEAALEVEPQLGRWKYCFGEATGRMPRLTGSGSVWFVEGSPEELGLAGRSHLVLGGQRGALVPVRTAPAEL